MAHQTDAATDAQTRTEELRAAEPEPVDDTTVGSDHTLYLDRDDAVLGTPRKYAPVEVTTESGESFKGTCTTFGRVSGHSGRFYQHEVALHVEDLGTVWVHTARDGADAVELDSRDAEGAWNESLGELATVDFTVEYDDDEESDDDPELVTDGGQQLCSDEERDRVRQLLDDVPDEELPLGHVSTSPCGDVDLPSDFQEHTHLVDGAEGDEAVCGHGAGGLRVFGGELREGETYDDVREWIAYRDDMCPDCQRAVVERATDDAVDPDVERFDFTVQGASETPDADRLRAVDSVTVGYYSRKSGTDIEIEIETERVEELAGSDQTYWFEGNPHGREADCYQVDFGTVTSTTHAGNVTVIGTVEYVDVPVADDAVLTCDHCGEEYEPGGRRELNLGKPSGYCDVLCLLDAQESDSDEGLATDGGAGQ